MTTAAHEFLDYKEVDVHFVFSFNWTPKDTQRFSFDIFQGDPTGSNVNGRVANESCRSALCHQPIFGKWYPRPIHERPVPPLKKNTGATGATNNVGSNSHSSHMAPDEQALFSSYNPAFSVRRRALAYQGFLAKPAFVVVPCHHRSRILPAIETIEKIGADRPNLCWIDNDGLLMSNPAPQGSIGTALIRVSLLWMIRLFDTGVGTVTVTVRRPLLDVLPQHAERAERYKLIHWLLHLSPNTDRHEAPWELSDDLEPTDAFLLIPDAPKDICQYWELEKGPQSTLADAPAPDDMVDSTNTTNDAASPDGKRCRLTRLFDFAYAIVKQALDVFNSSREFSGMAIEADNEFLQPRKLFVPKQFSPKPFPAAASWEYRFQVWNESQTPFIVTSAVVSEASISEIQDCVSLRRAQEIAALLVKLTLDNNRITRDFTHLNPDYIARYLPTTKDGRLLNMCLDDRVFFSMSRRGALSIAPVESALPESGVPVAGGPSSIGRGPAYFVIPSLLNLCELLRTQIHAATSLTWELSQFTNFIAAHRDRGDLDSVYERYAGLRRKLLLNLQNPINHLFDGGSVTEVAAAAEDLLMINSAWRQVDKAFSAMDDYIRTNGSLWLSFSRRSK